MRLLFVLPLLAMVALVAAKKRCNAPKWQLVFKAVAGIASAEEKDALLVDPYAVWDREAPLNEDVAEASKLDTSFKGHFKSSLTTNWERRHIQEVKVALLNDKGKELVSLVFDAEGSDSKNWFTRDRLLSSPWDDIFMEPGNYFKVSGHDSVQRRWFLNRNYGGCGADAGWLFIGGDNTPICSWEKRFARPQFLYSKEKTFTNWNTEDSIGEASIFAIFVRTNCPY